MAIIPKKLSFQLHFRNKTNTRKILSRNFQLQGLLKKHLNNSSRFYYPFVKKKEQKHLLKNPQTERSLAIINQETKVIKKAEFFSKSLKENLLYLGSPKMYHTETSLVIKEKAKCLLFTWVVTKIKGHCYLQTRKNSQSNFIKPNQHAYIYKKKSFFRPSWFLTNRIKINNNYHIKLKKVENSNVQLTENPENFNTLKLQESLSTDLLSNKNNSSNNDIKSDCIFFKKKSTVRPKAKKLLFGRYGICFKQSSIISSKCVETAKLDIARNLRKKGRFWIRICCDTPVSARPAETRMGKGKGSISYWAAKVNPGQLFFEFSGVSLVQLKEIYQKLCKKSAVSLKMVY